MNSVTEKVQLDSDETNKAIDEAPNKQPNNRIQFRWKGKIVKESTYKQKLALQEAVKKRKLASLVQAEKQYAKIPVDGRRIVDLELLANHLKCSACNEILSLADTATETRRGLASILHVRCRNCSEVTCVPTSKSVIDKESRGRLYTVNSDVVSGATEVGLTCNRLNKLLASFGIPQLQWKLFQRYKHESTIATADSDTEEKSDISAGVALTTAKDVKDTKEIQKAPNDIVKK